MRTFSGNRVLLEAALSEFERRRAKVDEQIAFVRSALSRAAPAQTPSADTSAPSGRNVAKRSARRGGAWTPERRRRMAEAMKRRWADGSIQRALKRAKR
jgi:hypothetical protein